MKQIKRVKTSVYCYRERVKTLGFGLGGEGGGGTEIAFNVYCQAMRSWSFHCQFLGNPGQPTTRVYLLTWGMYVSYRIFQIRDGVFDCLIMGF